jgi:hypothetical protein
VGGNFITIGSKPRNRIAALDAVTGVATDWNPNASGAVNALAVGPDAIYAGGAFNAIGSQNRNRFGALDPITGLATPLAADANGTVNSLLLTGTTLLRWRVPLPRSARTCGAMLRRWILRPVH